MFNKRLVTIMHKKILKLTENNPVEKCKDIERQLRKQMSIENKYVSRYLFYYLIVMIEMEINNNT